MSKCAWYSNPGGAGCICTPSPGASLNEPRPELQQLALNFLRRFFSCHLPKQRPSFSRHYPRSSSVWALYIALTSRTFPLRQCIRPFTTNKALSGPPLHRDKALLPPCHPRSGGFGGGLRRICAPHAPLSMPTLLACCNIFTALHGIQTRSSDEKAVGPSVRLTNAWIVTKRKKDLSRYLHHTKDHLAQFSEKKNGWWGATPSTWNFGSTGSRWSEIADFEQIIARTVSAITPSEKKFN